MERREFEAPARGGTLVGYVTDFFGTRLAEIRAPFAGEVLYVIGTPAISKGEPVAFIAQAGSPLVQLYNP